MVSVSLKKKAKPGAEKQVKNNEREKRQAGARKIETRTTYSKNTQRHAISL
jgi:hypothetical protein